jgi:hypothetical protein
LERCAAHCAAAQGPADLDTALSHRLALALKHNGISECLRALINDGCVKSQASIESSMIFDRTATERLLLRRYRIIAAQILN